jgi:hypothetical protein
MSMHDSVESGDEAPCWDEPASGELILGENGAEESELV